jgi:hypothetical protein
VSPAALTLGSIVSVPGNPMDRNIRGGIPYTLTPQKFEGYYKFEPAGNDNGFIACILYKYNYITGKQDTVAAAIYRPNVNTPQFSPFSVNFDYTGPQSNYVDEIPDTMNIVITSSFKYTATSSNVGTILYVDQLSIIIDSTSTFINNDENIENNLFASFPTKGSLTITNKTGRTFKMQAFDVQGRKVSDCVQIEKDENHLSWSAGAGIYVLNFSDGISQYQKKIINY